VHSCISNEFTDSEYSLRAMGMKFADEVLRYLEDKVPMFLNTTTNNSAEENPFCCRISFIGHSLGGLIIRCALQEARLQILRDKLHVFISLATPHLGNCFSDSPLVSTGKNPVYNIIIYILSNEYDIIIFSMLIGMWALSRWKNYRCLQELVMEDGETLEDSILYRLSLPSPPGFNTDNTSNTSSKINYSNALQAFKKVIFVSSPKDQYVSTYSARVQVCYHCILYTLIIIIYYVRLVPKLKQIDNEVVI
jgi:hypothetical protein